MSHGFHVGDTFTLDTLRRKFERLAQQWRRNTMHISSISETAMDENYQEIIGMGRPAVPFIIEQLRKKPGHWFWALRAITGVDPVQRRDEGNMRAMAAAWIRWHDRQYGVITIGPVQNSAQNADIMLPALGSPAPGPQ